MSEKSTGADGASAAVKLLLSAGESDTVYADHYLRRARELLGTALSPEQYTVLKGIQRDIDAAAKQLKVATASQDWKGVESLAQQVEDLRRRADANAEASALGVAVYDTHDVKIDPFSPGFESLPGLEHNLSERRDALVATLKALAGADPALASFYESRRTFFASLALISTQATTTPTSVKSSAEIQQLAMQAAQHGDMSRLRLYAQELSARQAKGPTSAADKSATPAAAVERAVCQCPVDLSAPFTDEVVQQARALGLAAARAEPPAQSAPLFEYVTTRIWQPTISDSDTAHEGTTRVEAMVDESGFPPEMSGPLKDLVGQLLHNGFINSGGARYIPPFSAETILVEDFPETEEAPAAGELLSALGLTRRRALARKDIEAALLQHGATVLQRRLLLDPTEFRLVCIPHDLYIGLGRDRGWGRQQQWTHFDGFRVFTNGKLQALVGGSALYGGLTDLVSIGVSDERQNVIARFAVIRRARQVARWH